jgi:hypothetical protein
MNKEPNLSDKEIIKSPEIIDNNFALSKPRSEIEFLVIEKTGKL